MPRKSARPSIKAPKKKKRIEPPREKKNVSSFSFFSPKALIADFPRDAFAFEPGLKSIELGVLGETIAIAKLTLASEAKKAPGAACRAAIRFLKTCETQPDHPFADTLIETCGDILPAIALHSGVQGHDLLQAIIRAAHATKTPDIFDNVKSTATINGSKRGFMIAPLLVNSKKETGFAVTTNDLRPGRGVLFIEGNARFNSANAMLKNRQLLRGHDLPLEIVHVFACQFTGRYQPKEGALSLNAENHYGDFARASQSLTSAKTRRALKSTGAALLERIHESRPLMQAAPVQVSELRAG